MSTTIRVIAPDKVPTSHKETAPSVLRENARLHAKCLVPADYAPKGRKAPPDASKRVVDQTYSTREAADKRKRERAAADAALRASMKGPTGAKPLHKHAK